MITLGLDPSLTGFGWSIIDSEQAAGQGRLVAKGVFTTKATQMFVLRYQYLREAVIQLLDTYPEVECVGAESPPFGEQFSEGLYGLYLFVSEALYTKRKDVVFFDPARVKLMARVDPTIRRGTMDKRDMIEAAKVDTGVKHWNHNEADAYIVARSASRFWEFFHGKLQESDLLPAELQTFLKVHTFTKGRKAGRTVKKGILFKEGERFFQFSLAPQDSPIVVQFSR